MEKEKKSWEEAAAEKEVILKKKIGTIGNIVHESVPVNNDEVFLYGQHTSCFRLNKY